MSEIEKETLLERIDEALNDIRPHLMVDGGNVELVGVTENLTVQIRLVGNCESCSMSEMTMQAGIAQTIKGKIPEVLGVEAVN